MEFAEEGGEGATPYEVLLHAAHGRQLDALHAPGRRRGDLEDHAAAARRPAARPLLRARIVGARGGQGARRRATAAGRAVGRMSETADPPPMPQSAAAPSPFPPIAEYAFLSDCHTGALVAPDGAIDWLCVPRFDSPSVFGSLLDREAGFFRLAPFGINHPTSVVYVPGTNVLETTWKTPNGWVVVRDALTMGPRGGEDTITPHTRPPADDDADHMLVRTIECLEGNVEVELVCEPAFDYGRSRRSGSSWGTTVTPQTQAGPARPFVFRPTLRWGSRGAASVRGTCSRKASAPTAPCPGKRASSRRRTPTRRGRAWTRRSGSGGPGSAAPGSRITASATRSSAPRSRSRGSRSCRPGRPWPRSRPRCPRPRAESGTGTTATPGSATRRSPSRRCTTSISTGRPTSSCSSSPTSSRPRTGRCRSCTGSTAGGTSPRRRATS